MLNRIHHNIIFMIQSSSHLYIFKMFGAMQFTYYINRSIATNVDSTYLSYSPTAHSVYVLW